MAWYAGWSERLRHDSCVDNGHQRLGAGHARGSSRGLLTAQPTKRHQDDLLCCNTRDSFSRLSYGKKDSIQGRDHRIRISK
jgi:hypothetical protein